MIRSRANTNWRNTLRRSMSAIGAACSSTERTWGARRHGEKGAPGRVCPRLHGGIRQHPDRRPPHRQTRNRQIRSCSTHPRRPGPTLAAGRATDRLPPAPPRPVGRRRQHPRPNRGPRCHRGSRPQPRPTTAVIYRTCRQAARDRPDCDTETRMASPHARALITNSSPASGPAAAAIWHADALGYTSLLTRRPGYAP
jgi:hypothetical protein